MDNKPTNQSNPERGKKFARITLICGAIVVLAGLARLIFVLTTEPDQAIYGTALASRYVIPVAFLLSGVFLILAGRNSNKQN